MDFLTELRAQEWADESAYAALDESERETEEGAALLYAISEVSESSYSLYDVDKDGVPELFVEYGNCEAAYRTRCCTFRDGKMALAGEFLSGHSGLCTCPDRSAFLVSWGQMGYARILEYAMENGVLTEERELFTEERVLEYTQANEIVPGAEYIDSFYTKLGEYSPYPDDRPQPSGGKALLLPVCDWYDGPAPTGQSTETARAAILAALNGKTELYGASGDHFSGDTGRTTWEKYIQPGVADSFNDVPLEVTSHVWQDMNGDGQEECVLQLQSDVGTAVVVLSEQEGAVYAYYFEYYEDAVFYTDGTILNPYGGTERLSFWKSQCYQYTVSAAAAQPVEWTEGAPRA